MTTTYRTKSLGTKLTEAEYDSIATRAQPLTVSEWARGILLDAAQPDRVHLAILAELIALRTILLNLHVALAKGAPLANDVVQSTIERADAEKYSKAEERIARLRPAALPARR